MRPRNSLQFILKMQQAINGHTPLLYVGIRIVKKQLLTGQVCSI